MYVCTLWQRRGGADTPPPLRDLTCVNTCTAEPWQAASVDSLPPTAEPVVVIKARRQGCQLRCQLSAGGGWQKLTAGCEMSC